MSTLSSPLIAVRAVVNGRPCDFGVLPDESAVEAIRHRLGLTGAKLACGQGACGACTVMVDGTPVTTCIMPATSLEGRTVRTIEDLGGGGLHPVQRAFLAEDALQCGYCTPGFVIEAAAFCDRWRAEHGSTEPDRATIAAALAGHLCRCGAYDAIYAAVGRACGGEFDADHPLSMPRRDGLEKVTGSAAYTVDVRYDGLLEGRILRSPHGHARITKLDWSRAERLPGVAAVVRMTTQSGLLRYAGQEILAVAAVDRATAEQALSLIDIEMEVLPAVVNMDAARADGAPLVYSARNERRQAPNAAEGAPLPSGWHGNLRGPFSFFSKRAGKAREALERARQTSGWHVAAGTWRVQTQCHTTLEPHACVAAWDAGGGLTVHVSTQSVVRVAKDIAARWKLKEEKVRVLAPYVGGGFGSKAGISPEILAAVDLAKAAGAPVRVVLDRREELAVGGIRPTHELQLAVAADAEGRLVGMTLKSYGSAGVAIGNSTTFLYRIMYSQAPKELLDWDVMTHAAPGKPFRGPGGPPALWALEQAIDAVAVARNEDPIALRQRWDESEVRQRLYTWAKALPVWSARGPVAQDRGRFRRGVGVAAAGWLYFTNPATRVRVDTSPNGIVASTACQDMGNGTRSVIADAVAAVFGIDASRVDVHVGDSRYVEGPMSSGSRTTASVVPCAEDAAVWLRDRLVDVAGQRLGCQNARAVPGGIAHDGGFIAWDDMLRVAEPLSCEGRRKRDKGGYFLPFRFDGVAIGKYLSGAVQVTSVEVDTRLGNVRVLETWAGIGVGRIVSPRLARSQAQGGLVQGISYALYEERRLDPTSGALLTGSLDDYRIAGIGDIGPLHIHFDQEGFENAQSRAVGLGEIVTMAPAASIGNAVYHATGWRPQELPLRPDRVLAGIKQ